MSELLQQLVNGIGLGSVYALIAVGYTMVYGIIQLINFAHGEVFMMGSFFTYTFYRIAHLPLLVAALLGIMLAVVLGLVIERVAYRPLRHSARLAPLISAIGVSLVLQNAALLIWGPDRKAMLGADSAMGGLNDPITIGGVTTSGLQFSLLVIAILVMVAMDFLVHRTQLGRAMRACSMDITAAALVGVPVDRIIAFTFALGSGLAALAGIMVALRYNQVYPMMGFMAGLKAFTAAVLGGIGNLRGAFLGGLMLGVIEALVGGYVSSLWMDAIAFGVLVAVLIVRPNGLLGTSVAVKV